MRIAIIGPAYPLRGGLSTFNHRLAKEFIDLGHECTIWSFSLQYPSILFPGKTQYSDEPAPNNINIISEINSINPLSWIKVGNKLKKQELDIVIVRYWLPFMGPALGTIIRILKRNKKTKVICIADNVIPHEKRIGDKIFTKYFLKSCDAFITMSEKVMKDLRTFDNNKTAQIVEHPLYDNFGNIVSKYDARAYLNIPQDEKIVLFFGFIRKYKGLDLLIEAMHELNKKNTNIKLLIAGEFYEDEEQYLQLIKQYNLEDKIILHTNFIADSDVKYYLCSADVLVQPYKNATQSGVTPLAYYFEKPMIVTNVGGLPALVPDKKCGIIVEPNPKDIAKGIEEFFNIGEAHFIPFIRNEQQKFSWKNIADNILSLSNK